MKRVDNFSSGPSMLPSEVLSKAQGELLNYKDTGMSVMEYLLSCRMASAKRMLAGTQMGIGEIVERCGFSDNSNFSRTFKALNGMSPTDFRKKYTAE